MYKFTLQLYCLTNILAFIARSIFSD